MKIGKKFATRPRSLQVETGHAPGSPNNMFVCKILPIFATTYCGTVAKRETSRTWQELLQINDSKIPEGDASSPSSFCRQL